MSGPTPSDHHRSSLKVNRRVLLQTSRRVSIKLWPLYAFLFLAKLFVNLRDQQDFDFVQDVLAALWPPVLFGCFFFGCFFSLLLVGTKSKMKQARVNPGPGKPARDRPGRPSV